MSYIARNHPQQTAARGPLAEALFPLEDGYGATDEVDDRGTTPELFAELHTRFAFTIDVAAAAHNAKLPRYYDIASNGLAQPWYGERVFCNPPYSNIRPWVEKAWCSGAELIVMLLPANRTEQGWWQDLIEQERRQGVIDVEFLPGRIRFLRPGQHAIGPNERPPFGICLVIWGDD